MGQGDTLMSIGEAKRIHARTRQPVLITDRHGRPIRSDLFNGVPYLIAQPTRAPYQRHVNCGGVRPYIRFKYADRWVWNKYQPEPADIVFTREELAFAEPYRGSIMVEPHVKSIGHRNKDWGWANWAQLDALMHTEGIGPVLQCIKPGEFVLLPHVNHAVTDTFRKTLAVLSVCRAYVGTEGGLHHGAAAVRTPAVVIFGGFISPEITGYKQHQNLYAGGEPCGRRIDCPHCRAAMNKITPARVLGALKEILK